MLLSKEMQDKIVSLLVENGLADAGLVKKTYNEVAKSGQPILAVLRSKGIATDDCVQHATAIVLNVPYIDLRKIKFNKEKLLIIPQDVAKRSRVVPLDEQNGQLFVAMLDNTNIQQIDYLSTLVKKPIRSMLTSEAGVENALAQYMADLKDVNKIAQQEESQKSGDSDAQTITQDSPISKALSTILENAVKSKASDIHIEPLEHSLVIRMRIDGVLRWSYQKRLRHRLFRVLKLWRN